ncbi:protein MgtS [Pectobacterium brasiliense]|nr:protein MgtS [Pectobacterium brasiliense]MBA0213634.1 protein MgtS [Pectobacterium brasiliense]
MLGNINIFIAVLGGILFLSFLAVYLSPRWDD